ncbi:helix-turn-helix domain-containing protein [Streptomyces phaeochromogenes]|uniref:helix-turn-helix domain-containing protein n=1 Tax=Streptomyces phaeochromogenes TaxID=1923 RepID=UPI00340D5E25
MPPGAADRGGDRRRAAPGGTLLTAALTTEARKQYGPAQKDVAARTKVSIARVSRIEHGEVATLDVVARCVEALGGRLDLVADFGDHTVRMPASGFFGERQAERFPTRISLCAA